MFRVSLKLGRVNKGMGVYFNLIVKDDPQPNKAVPPKINYFKMNGNEYLNLSPTPYVTIDISTSKTRKIEGYNPNRSINLNGFSLYLLICGLKRLLYSFKNESGLYYYDDGELVVDKDLSVDTMETVQLGDKKIRMQAVVVPSEDNPNVTYEGCAFFINSFDTFQYLTITEIEYLLHLLSQVNMWNLTAALLNYVKEKDVVVEDRNELEVETVDTIPSAPYVPIANDNPLPNA